LSIWFTIRTAPGPNILDDVPVREEHGDPDGHGGTQYIGVATSGWSTVCRLSIDNDDVFLSAAEAVELIAALQIAVSPLTPWRTP